MIVILERGKNLWRMNEVSKERGSRKKVKKDEEIFLMKNPRS